MQFLKYRADVSEKLLQIGKISFFGHETAEASKFLPCDGSAVSRATHAKLFAKIGTSWGIGDGSTTFNLPDMRGQVPRGKDGGAGIDPDAGSRTANNGGNSGDAIGSYQADAFQNWHLGGVLSGNTYFGRINSVNYTNNEQALTNYGSIRFATGWQGLAEGLRPLNDGTNGEPRTSAESRMKNANVAFYIRYEI